MLACNIVTANFPIGEVLPDIFSALLENTRLVLEAPPGAGKTTQVRLLYCRRRGAPIKKS